jgi:hypothetical protein
MQSTTFLSGTGLRGWKLECRFQCACPGMEFSNVISWNFSEPPCTAPPRSKSGWHHGFLCSETILHVASRSCARWSCKFQDNCKFWDNLASYGTISQVAGPSCKLRYSLASCGFFLRISRQSFHHTSCGTILQNSEIILQGTGPSCKLRHNLASCKFILQVTVKSCIVCGYKNLLGSLHCSSL